MSAMDRCGGCGGSVMFPLCTWCAHNAERKVIHRERIRILGLFESVIEGETANDAYEEIQKLIRELKAE